MKGSDVWCGNGDVWTENFLNDHEEDLKDLERVVVFHVPEVMKMILQG